MLKLAHACRLPALRFPAEAGRAIRRIGAMLTAAAVMLAPGIAGALEIRLKGGSEAGMTVVDLAGRIERGDAVRVQTFLEQLPRTQPIAVEMHSGGGLIDEALSMGRYFHAQGIRTYVKGEGRHCLSACAHAFLAGRDLLSRATFRVKGAQAKIGFHGFRRNIADKEFTVADMHQAIADTQKVMLLITDYLGEISADIEFLSMMLEAPNTAMTYMSNEKAVTIGVHVLNETTGELLTPRPTARAGREK